MAEPLKTPEQLAEEQKAADEAKFRSYVKEKYGIEDDPETFTTKRKKWEEAETAVPKYQEALSYAQQIAQENARLKAERQAASQTQTKTPQDEETELRALAEKDPWGALMEMRRRDRTQYETLLARHARGVDERVIGMTQAQVQAKDADQRIRAEWPDAYDTSSDLYKTGNDVYWREFSDFERAHPLAHLRATEIAAGRLGIGPTSRRAKETSSKEIGHEVEGQNVGSKGRRPSSDDAPKLTDADQAILKAFEIDDTKTFLQAKKARAEKKNVEVKG